MGGPWKNRTILWDSDLMGLRGVSTRNSHVHFAVLHRNDGVQLKIYISDNKVVDEMHPSVREAKKKARIYAIMSERFGDAEEAPGEYEEE